MNIIEASKCGKPVRPKGSGCAFDDWESWIRRTAPELWSYLGSEWEAEEKKVEVTESQARRAIEAAMMPHIEEYLLESILNKLGLGDPNEK